MAFVPISIAFVTAFWYLLFSGIFFGLGYGAYVSVDFALASDVLPHSESHGRDLGVWHLAWAIPSVLTPPIAGVLIDFLQPQSAAVGISNLGYRVVFLLTGLLLLLAAIGVYPIRSEQRSAVIQLDQLDKGPQETEFEELEANSNGFLNHNHNHNASQKDQEDQEDDRDNDDDDDDDDNEEEMM